MTTNATIRVNFQSREFEVSGSEQFVRDHLKELWELVDTEKPRSTLDHGDTSAQDRNPPTTDGLPAEFGEYYHCFACDLTDNDKVLIGAAYLQYHDDDNQFSTHAINDLLRAHGIKISNPSLCVKRSVANRRVFSLTKRSFRVAELGRTHLAELRNKSDAST